MVGLRSLNRVEKVLRWDERRKGPFGCCLENRASGRTAGSLCLESRVSGLGLVDGALFPSEQPKLVPVPWDGY